MSLLQESFREKIITPRLSIVHPFLEPSVLLDYCEAINESLEVLQPWLAWARYVPTQAQAMQYVKATMQNWLDKTDNDLGLVFWLFSRQQRRFLGSVVFWNINWFLPKIEVGYWLRLSAQQQGYMVEALNALTRYAFQRIKINRLEIRCELPNKVAQRIPLKLGFTREGVLHHSTRAVRDNSLEDVVMFARTNLIELPELTVTWRSELLETSG